MIDRTYSAANSDSAQTAGSQDPSAAPRIAPTTWLMIAFGFSIPMFFVTLRAAMTENWTVLAPILILMAVGEAAMVVLKPRKG